MMKDLAREMPSEEIEELFDAPDVKDAVVLYPPNRLRELRVQAGLTQAEVAKLIGTSNFVVSRHEREGRPISHETILKYADVFKVYTYELFQQPIHKHEDWTDTAALPTEYEGLLARDG